MPIVRYDSAAHGHPRTPPVHDSILRSVPAGAGRGAARGTADRGLSRLARSDGSRAGQRSTCRPGAPAGWRRTVFLDKLGGEAAILPRLVPIGDIDEDEIVFAEFAGGPLAGERLALPPAIEPFERKANLTRMILAWAARKRDAESSLIANTPAAAFAMAGELARLQDDMITRGVDWKALDTLVPDELDRHFGDARLSRRSRGRSGRPCSRNGRRWTRRRGAMR